MPKKKKSDDIGINMDVMMDSMTNVVGTLLLILIVVQIQISTAVETIETVLKNITKKDLQTLSAKIAEQNKSIKDVNVDALEEEYRKAMGDVDEAQLRVNIYASEVKEKSKNGLLDVQELIEMKVEKAGSVELEQNIFNDLSRERQRLEALLAKTPKPKIPAGADISVPAGLAVPKGPKYVKLMCMHNRLFYMQDYDYRIMAEKMMEPMMSSMIYSNYIDPKSKRPVIIYDHKKTYALIQKIATNLNKGNTNFLINTYDDPYYTRVRLRLTPEKTGGIAMADLVDRDNQLRKDVIRIKRDPKNVIWFYVYKDSLDVYLKARDICQALGMPQGWEYYRWTAMAPSLKFAVNPLKVRTNRVSAVAGRARASAIVIKGPKKTLN
jgi:hypothetical protein